jgi:CheY-like chemotaxis protein
MMQLSRSINYLADRLSQPPFDLSMSESEAEGAAARLPRILIVDDERLLADTTASVLRHAGFQTKTAYDGFGALDVMASFHPDYLLTDIMMPAMNGVELAIAAVNTYPAIKILLFSGQAGIADIMEGSRARGFEFPLLAKPVHPSKLIECLRNLKNR